MSANGKTVLLVEDNEDNRIVYSTILRHFGYEVSEALNGEEGIAKARAEKPDLILMDIQLPGIDGLEATRRLRQESPPGHAAAVLMLTTFDLDAYVYDALRAGASGFLLKDTLPEDLVAAIEMPHIPRELLPVAALERRLARMDDLERVIVATLLAYDGWMDAAMLFESVGAPASAPMYFESLPSCSCGT